MIYVAFRYDDNPEKGREEKLADGSIQELKRRLKAHPGTLWTIVEYEFQKTVKFICQCIEDPTELPARAGEAFTVTSTGRVQKLQRKKRQAKV